MRKEQNPNSNTYNQTSQLKQHLENLTTEELQNRLDDLILNESISMEDAALIDLYCQELDKREGVESHISSEQSLRDFYQKNKLVLDDEASVLQLSPKPVKRISLSRYIAVAVITILVVGLLATQAFGLNLWHTIAKWTNDTFGFLYETTETSSDDAEEVAYSNLEQSDICSELQAAMLSDGIDTAVVPTYLPEGFMQTEFYQGNNPLSYTAVYEHGGDTIVIQIVKTTNQMGREFQKEAEQPEVYVQNGIKHYIMENTGTYLAVWTDDGLECSITGVPTLDEMYKMIDSIY